MPAAALAVCARSAADTRRLAHCLAAAFFPPPPLPFRLYLSGALGAGKTAFVAALLAALGERGRVRSPTFALAHTYRIAAAHADAAPLIAHHLDAYRLLGAPLGDDLQELLAASALCLLEWPENAADLPAPDLRLHFTLPAPATDIDDDNDSPRAIRISAHTPSARALLHRLQQLWQAQPAPAAA